MDRRGDEVVKLKLTSNRGDTGGYRSLVSNSIAVMVTESRLCGRLSVHQSHLTAYLFYQLQLVYLLLLKGHQLIQDHGNSHSGDPTARCCPYTL